MMCLATHPQGPINKGFILNFPQPKTPDLSAGGIAFVLPFVSLLLYLPPTPASSRSRRASVAEKFDPAEEKEDADDGSADGKPPVGAGNALDGLSGAS